MVQCSNCEFRTRFPGGKKCWELDAPLCGKCAYELDQKLVKKSEALENNILIKRFIQTEIIPVLLQYKQNPNFKFYKKMYIRKPSTNGGRLSRKSSNLGVVLTHTEEKLTLE